MSTRTSASSVLPPQQNGAEFLMHLNVPHACAAFDVLAFLCGWMEGLRDLDEALQEDGLFAREVRLGDCGGSSTACSRSGDRLRESLDLMTCVPFPLFLPSSVSYFFRPYPDVNILMTLCMSKVCVTLPLSLPQCCVLK